MSYLVLRLTLGAKVPIARRIRVSREMARFRRSSERTRSSGVSLQILWWGRSDGDWELLGQEGRVFGLAPWPLQANTEEEEQ